jgi:hypothetical protein
MDAEMTALKAAPAMATSVIETNNVLRMVVSMSLVMCYGGAITS